MTEDGDVREEADEPTFAAPAAREATRRDRRLGVVAAAVLLVAVTAGAFWIGRRSTAPSPVGHAAVHVEGFTFRLSRPDGWSAVVTIADGGAGQFSGPPGAPAVVLRPRRVPAGLMLEIGRADGLPATGRPGAPGPLVLLLDPNTETVARDPFPFVVRWVGSPVARRD